ncbi:hypothetical protein CLF_106419 [Clonorchis sinensis]|uniref:Uncharacterized protein n=1 Tax=Clonorchis sinensis TaxID=79923 RepID=G7YPX5_CLOSI|nr:hypothetical protein CLF_106419 [Clonorchis sinensis]
MPIVAQPERGKQQHNGEEGTTSGTCLLREKSARFWEQEELASGTKSSVMKPGKTNGVKESETTEVNQNFEGKPGRLDPEEKRLGPDENSVRCCKYRRKWATGNGRGSKKMVAKVPPDWEIRISVAALAGLDEKIVTGGVMGTFDSLGGPWRCRPVTSRLNERRLSGAFKPTRSEYLRIAMQETVTGGKNPVYVLQQVSGCQKAYGQGESIYLILGRNGTEVLVEDLKLIYLMQAQELETYIVCGVASTTELHPVERYGTVQLPGERQPLNDKKETNPGNFGESPDPVY